MVEEDGVRTRRGLRLFARYAYPPNELGYCGPGDHGALLDYSASGAVDEGLRELARGFEGPWPYLTLIAGAAGLDDPFDERVVEAYWVGNRLLDRVPTEAFGRTVERYFKPLVGSRYPQLAEAVPAGALAHHSFHVLGVYPWIDLLRGGRVHEPLEQMDRCRIRWGRVLASEGDHVVVRSRPLRFDGTDLSLGPAETETVTRATGGRSPVGDLRVGEWVSMHWHWVCDRLDPGRLAALRRYTAHQLEVTNRRVDHSGPGVIMAGG